jgi:peptide/nickel transport system substrate-binding protein
MLGLTRARSAGLVTTAMLVLAAGYCWRNPTPSGGSRASAPIRGGQIVASVRSEPRSFTRLTSRDQMAELLAMLTQGKLVRINRATFEVEPWLAERWESSKNGLSHTFHLRQGLEWSDGAALTSADVVFSLEAAFDRRVKSPMAEMLLAGGQPIRASAPDPQTVVVTFAGPSGPGVRLLDMLTVLPKHKLGAALADGTLGEAWSSRTPPSEIVGSGPFVLRSYEPGQRLVLERNPRYWRKAPDGAPLPYLDRIVLEIVPDQNAELIRLQSGALDLTASAIAPDDYVPVRRAEEAGRVRLTEIGVSTDVDTLWFCLKPEVKRKDPRFAFVSRPEFRRALSHAVDREAFAQDVFLGEAVPVWGPITPGNRTWFTPNLPRYAYDVERARELLKSIGLEDRNGNGVVEDGAGTEARFTLITQRGIAWYERGTTVLREKAAQIGVALDIAPLESAAMIPKLLQCDYDAIYMRPLMTDLDPAGNADFWMSSGDTHFWNIGQKTPATEWEARLDTLFLEQASTLDPERRRAIFNDAQRILAENLPVIHFAAPRLYYGHSLRLAGVTPSVMRPPILWSADTLSVTNP